MRWYHSGTNWQNIDWISADPIKTLCDQYAALYPKNHPTDGTVASKNHDLANPTSDHRPREGKVRATDIGVFSDIEGEQLFQALRVSRDPRIRYVIWKKRLFSSYGHANGPPYSERPYSGSEHKTHVHISSLVIADNDDEPWELGLDNMAKAVEGIQRNLNAGGYADPPLVVDGDWGPKTEAAHLAMVEAKPDLVDHVHDLATVNKTGPVT